MKNKISIQALSLLFFILLSSIAAQGQVFPEVVSPAAEKKKQEQENEKIAFQYFADKDYEKALELFRDLYDKNPSYHHYYYYFLCLVAMEQFDEAEKMVKGRIKDQSGNSRFEVDLGYIYLLTDKPDKASRTFDEVIGQMSPNKANINEVANAFQTRQLYDYAIKTFLKGRELLQYRELFHQDLARIYELSGNYQSMIEEYLDLLEVEPGKLELVQNRFQNTLSKDIDDKISEMLRESLLKRNQLNPENRYYAEMLLWLSVQRKDFEFALIQARSIDTRFNEGGMMVFSIANLCIANKDYDVAIEAFEYLLGKGPMSPYFTESITGNLQARFLKVIKGFDYKTSDLTTLKKEYLAALDELGRNARTVILMRDLAHLEAFYLDQLEESLELLESALAIPGTPPQIQAEIKLELGDIYLFVGEVWEASLLYSQVEKSFKNDPIGHEAKFRNARLSYYIGEFGWAKAQLDVLKAATSKLIANDAMDLSLLIGDNMDTDSTYTALAYFSRADLLMYRGQDSLALLTLDSISMLSLYHSLDDEVLFSKAEIFIRNREYGRADSALLEITRNYANDILADNALFKRAELQASVYGNKPKAMELYEQLMIDYPGSLFTTEARKRYRQLRGDFSN